MPPPLVDVRLGAFRIQFCADSGGCRFSGFGAGEKGGVLLAEDGEVASERFARLALGLQLFPQGVLGGGKFGAFGGECVFCLLLAHF